MPIERQRTYQSFKFPESVKISPAARLATAEERQRMFSIIGIVIVFGAVIGGFLMEKGPLLVLMQPSELVIIGGAALGTLLVANPLHVLKKIIGDILRVLAGSKFSQKRYLETLKMMFDLFNKARKEGLVSVESDVEEPGKSPLFSKFPEFLKDHHITHFVCDTMRMAGAGSGNHHERPGRAAGGDRAQGRGGSGRHISGYPALLRNDRADGQQSDQTQ
jgi:hypothetical protein